MATEAYFVSEDGTKGAYLHLANRPLPQARADLEDLWGQPVDAVPGRRALQRQIRSSEPPGQQSEG